MQVTIAHLSEANKNERIDSQFFLPEFVDSFNTVANGPYSMLSDIAHVTDGNHVKIAENFDDSEGIRYLRGQDLGTDMMLHDRNIVHIPESCFKALKRSHIFKDDILITIVGANTGLVGLVYEPSEKLVANCKLGIARVEISKIIPGYLYAFLIGRYGQHQILRSIRGGGQTGLILPDIRQLRIARLSSDFESRINDVSFYGHSKAMESKRVYGNAQNILLSELGLTDWQPKRQLTFVKNYSDTEHVERIDAEYYQPKYEEIVNAIKAYKGGWDTLGNLVTVKKCVEVGGGEYLEEGIPFVRVSNLSPFEITEEKYISEKLYAEIKQHQPKKGEILFSKDATPGIAYYLNEQPRKMIPSGGILRLKIKKDKADKVNNEYLTLALNSILTKEQANRDVGGSVILHWRPDQVKGTLIPILSEDKQTEIQQKVIESFNLRKKSKRLLECAKRAVEMAIEQDEKKAINWLENATKEMQIE
ncbi:MAG: restriction endonuclease subunit S [Nitrospira sp.]|nr:restriction endonuclease subunit S [Nitrospira sp.]